MTKMNLTAATMLAAGGLCSVVVAGTDQLVPVGRVSTIAPTWIEYNGIRYPANSGSNRVVQPVYDNGSTTAGPFFSSTAAPHKALDDFTFSPGPGAGSGRLVSSMKVAFVTPAVPIAPLQNLDVVVEIFNVCNPAVTPVNSASAGAFRVTFNAPAAPGWAGNTIYVSGAIDLTALPGGGIQTSGDGSAIHMGVEHRFYVPGGTTDAQLNPDFTVGFFGGGVTVGASDDVYWRDSNGNGVYDSGTDARFFNGAPNLANFVLEMEADAVPAVTGACCATDGSCSALSAAACASSHGTYGGDNSSCGTCPTGRCCLPDGTCVVISPGGCTLQSGTYGGDNSTCGTCTQPAVLVNNAYTGPLPRPEFGVFRTGANSASGIPAPFAAGANTQWSELQPQTASCNDTILGFNGSGTFRLADNFTLASSSTIQQVVVYPLLANNSPDPFATANFTSAVLQIWNGRPGDAGSTVVFGDTTTNRLAATGAKQFAYTYRTGWTGAGANVTTNFPVFRIAIDVNATFPAGNYWLDWSVGGPTANYDVAATIAGEAGGAVPGANARQFTAATTSWADVLDTGNPANCGSVQQDFPFLIVGTAGGSSCYANCDSSTALPFLNVQDFSCFLTKYAAGAAYANCDNSTQPPVLNVQDFSCFLTKYATGCSAP